MDFAILSAKQILIMFLLISIGFISFKKKLTNENGTAQLTNILMNIVFPAVILSAFLKRITPEKLQNFLIMTGLAIAGYLITILLSWLLIRKSKKRDYILERFAAIYPNNGFMGIPVIAALLGEDGIFYGTAFICVGNAFMWTHGVISMSKNGEGTGERISIKHILLTPTIIVFILGMIIAVTEIPLPEIITTTVTYVGNMNTPLAMFIVGTILAQNKIFDAFTDKRAYWIMIVSNFLIPLAVVTIYHFLPIQRELLLNNIISLSCPVSSVAVIFSEKYHHDNAAASRIFTLSNLMNIVSMPLLMLYAGIMI